MFSGWTEAYDLGLGELTTITIPVERSITITPQFSPLTGSSSLPDDISISNVQVNDTGEIEGDWFEFQVDREEDMDLGGWRVSDNDSVDADDEGSLIFVEDPLLEDLPKGTIVRVIATQTVHNTQRFPEDGWQNGMLLLYVGNDRVDSISDPWFNLGRRDNLVILAPGPTEKMTDDMPVAFWSNNSAVTSSSFGLPPGVPKE